MSSAAMTTLPSHLHNLLFLLLTATCSIPSVKAQCNFDMFTGATTPGANAVPMTGPVPPLSTWNNDPYVVKFDFKYPPNHPTTWAALWGGSSCGFPYASFKAGWGFIYERQCGPHPSLDQGRLPVSLFTPNVRYTISVERKLPSSTVAEAGCSYSGDPCVCKLRCPPGQTRYGDGSACQGGSIPNCDLGYCHGSPNPYPRCQSFTSKLLSSSGFEISSRDWAYPFSYTSTPNQAGAGWGGGTSERFTGVLYSIKFESRKGVCANTDAPTVTTESPTTRHPTTNPTRNPTTSTPTEMSKSPTLTPTTDHPTSCPTTMSPSTVGPSKTPTQNPTVQTDSPTSLSPTTCSPTTANPSTSPTSMSPSSNSPTFSPVTTSPTLQPFYKGDECQLHPTRGINEASCNLDGIRPRWWN